MPKLPRIARAGGAGKPIPWQMVITVGYQVVQESRKRWERLNKREQDQLVELLRRSRGRLNYLTQSERTELRRIVWKAVGPGS